MSVYLFVVDGLGVWNSERKSTLDYLMEMFGIDSSVFPFLYKVGLKEANAGKGNLLVPKSTIAGSLEGHREMMGYISNNEYDICSNRIPSSIIETMFLKTDIRCIGNIQGRGRDIIPQYSKQLGLSSVILYSGYDSTISVAFRDKDFPVMNIVEFANILMEELYKNNIKIRKIIIRQYDNNFISVKSRKEIFKKIQFDELIMALQFPKIIVNDKIQDILKLNCAEIKECNNDKDCFRILAETEEGFYFLNFPDFDYFAHQGNFLMCFNTIKNFDVFLEKFWQRLKKGDYIIITSDHGVKISNSDLSDTHILEDVILLCLDKFGYYYFDGERDGLYNIYNIIQSIQNNRHFYDDYCKLC